jgi:hypothetical protein
MLQKLKDDMYYFMQMIMMLATLENSPSLRAPFVPSAAGKTQRRWRLLLVWLLLLLLWLACILGACCCRRPCCCWLNENHN